MSDDQDPRYDEAAEPEEHALPGVDQPALFEDPTATPHDIEAVAPPEGSWEPDDGVPEEGEVDPGEPERWFPLPEGAGTDPVDEATEPEAAEAASELEPDLDDPAIDPETGSVDQATAGDVPDEAAALAALALLQEGPAQRVDDQDVLLEPVGELAPAEAVTADGSAAGTEQAVSAGTGGGLMAVLSLLLVGLLLLTGWLAYTVADSRGPAPIEATRASALDAGRDAARLVFSYDYRKLDKDFAAASAVTTGKFKTDYESTTKKLVGDVAPRYKAVLLAEVSEAGVITAKENEVQLLVFLDVQSTSTLAATPKITPRRLKMTMQRSGDRWLVSAVDAF